MDADKDGYIYLLRVERSDRSKQVNVGAEFKRTLTQMWADLTRKLSIYEVWNDDKDWEIRKRDHK